MTSPRLALLAAFLAATLTASAQERAEEPPAPTKIERAVERRVESWLRDRSSQRLRCKATPPRGQKQVCGGCEGTNIDPKKVDDALWRYFRPGFRRGLDRDRWIAETFMGQWRGGWGAAGSLMGDDFAVRKVVACRDVVWATVSKGDDEAKDTADVWVREDGNYFLDMTGEPVPDLLRHRWFVLGTLTQSWLYRELDRLARASAEEGLTDLERAARTEARAKAETELKTRVIADRSEVANVRPIEGRDAFIVEVATGNVAAQVQVDPTEGETAEALRTRLTGLTRGTRVFFRGRVAGWETPPGRLTVNVLEGEVSVE